MVHLSGNFFKFQNPTKINLYLYFVAITVNVASFSSGLASGWASPEFPKLHDPISSPLNSPLTSEDESWIASLLSFAAIVGPLTTGYLTDKIGRKRTLTLAFIFHIAAFTTCAFAKSASAFYVARVFMGFGLGINLSVVPIYIGEIAELKNRGILGCFMVGFMTMGNLFCFSVGPYTSVMVMNLACAAFPFIGLVVFCLCVPESPYYLIAKHQEDEAKQSLLKLRNSDTNAVDGELLEIQRIVNESVDGKISDVFKEKWLTKGTCITVVLVIVQQLSGITVILFYLQSIFEHSVTNIPSDVAGIIVGIVQCLGVLSASSIVDKFGRKPLLLLSCFGTCVVLIGLGVYFYLMERGQNITFLSWLPITALIIYIVSYNLGLGPLPYTILGEMFPPHVKSIVSTITVCTCLIVSFCTVKFVTFFENMVGTGGMYWIFASCSACGILFTVMVVPETKGRTLDEIQKLLHK